MFLITEWFGAFLLAEDGSVKEERLFPKDAAALATILQRLQDGMILEEERQLAVRAEGDVQVREMRQVRLPSAKHVTKAPSMADQAAQYGYDRKLLHQATMELGRSGVRTASSKRDMHVVQAVDAIDELHEQANILVERLREWYGLHFPEMVDASQPNEEVAALISSHADRDAIMAAQPQYKIASSMGGPLPELEQAAVRQLARTASTLYSTRAELEKYLDQAMPEVAPNVSVLLQPVLAARMVKQAGGIRRLATMPAGTIQTLGAEKALFRHIKEGKRPPKHGFLMQHPLVHRAPRHQRGALARSLAAKVALAARADVFTKSKESGARLAEEFAKRAEALKEKGQRMKRIKQKKAGFTGRPQGPPRGGGGGGFGGGGFQGKAKFRGGGR
ncbi:MAG: nucleolar protein 56 [Thermoplasmata archaeon]|jgi:nucleolar protein 56|nr:nucleolar protein 56 [Thermoplasmata archaeon]